MLSPRQEFGDCCRIEIEHLCSLELSFLKAIKAQDLSFKSLARRAEAALNPEHDHLIVSRGYHSWIHSSLLLGRLESNPGFGPTRAWMGYAAELATVGKGSRPAKFDIGPTKLTHEVLIAPFHCIEDAKHGLDICGVNAHKSSFPDLGCRE
jgi:hypothetical protein